MDLVEAVYRLSSRLPAEERFGLTSQIRRAAVSIPSNLAEGHGRSSSREFSRYVEIAIGSPAEVETQLLICERLNMIGAPDAEPTLELSAEVGRILNGLLKSL